MCNQRNAVVYVLIESNFINKIITTLVFDVWTIALEHSLHFTPPVGFERMIHACKLNNYV